MSSDTVVLEIATLSLPAGADGQLPDFWKQVDEQHLPLEFRQRLQENGLRCGLLDGQLPEAMRRRLAKNKEDQQTISEATINGDSQQISQQQMWNQAGRRGKIVTSPVREQLAVFTPDHGRLVGKTLYQAQCLFTVKTFPQGDGRVRLELTPEIEHGVPKQRWIGQSQEGAFRLDASREHEVFDQLRIEPILNPGQILVMSCIPEPKGLGGHFFLDSSPTAGEQRFLLIRVGHTQVDDLFAPEQAAEPLATPVD